MRRSIVLFPEPMIPDKATSDQFCQYGSKPIPSTVRDATYVLDGILDNETELPIAEHTSDTTRRVGLACCRRGRRERRTQGRDRSIGGSPRQHRSHLSQDLSARKADR